MKQRKRVLRWLIPLLLLALVLALVLLLLRGRAGTGLPLDEETGLLTEEAVSTLEDAYGLELSAALEKLGMSRLSVEPFPGSGTRWHTRTLTWNDREYSVMLNCIADDFNEYQIYLGPSLEGCSEEEALEVLDLWLSKATELYGEPLTSGNPHNTLAQADAIERLRAAEYNRYLYVTWKIGENTRFYINLYLGREGESCDLSLNYRAWKDQDITFGSETW